MLYNLSSGSMLTVGDVWTTWRNVITRYSHTDPYMTAAIIQTESNGDYTAKGPTNDYGLMQITPIVLKEFNVNQSHNYGIDDLFRPEINITIGSWYLERLVNHYKLNLYDALRAYNAGVGNVRKSDTAGSEYARKILNIYSAYVGINA